MTTTGNEGAETEGTEKEDFVWQGEHSVDARYRIPWFGGPIYLRVMVGRDRRPTTRFEKDRAASIRRSIMNIMLFAFGASLLYTAVAIALLMYSAVLT